MHFTRKIIGAMDQIRVNTGMVFRNTPDKIVGGWIGFNRRKDGVGRGDAHPALEPVIRSAVAVALQRFEHIGFIRIDRCRLRGNLRQIILR